ncbi:hypothetical protein EV664_1238 [Stakelama pacifica]|uniref:Uncharacterized protein n=2 Tax=Stakelama pacifica TaxID=517720 RepID=A0A4R6FC67_9SPHN|nr:hypothetical protein EV664_1238 [Stakelama pacifica]GGP00686.1 hypothetical protein GCM10011329_37150 [Stakelama pacifica]
MEHTTMTLKHQNWMWALRKEMGWPLFKPANDCLSFSSGRKMDAEIGTELGRVAVAMRKDVVYSSWTNAAVAEPSSYAVVLRDLLTINVTDRCVAWASTETSPVILISTRRDEMFAIGARGLLERVAGKPKSLAKGRKIAERRIRAAAQAMGGRLAENNVWLPMGADWVEPERPVETVVRFN